jgi:hypothetical protein
VQKERAMSAGGKIRVLSRGGLVVLEGCWCRRGQLGVRNKLAGSSGRELDVQEGRAENARGVCWVCRRGELVVWEGSTG